MNKVELFVPEHPIQVAQELQWEIDMAHPEIAPELGRRALDLLGDVREMLGGRHLFVHTLGALILDRGRSAHERTPWQFNELYLKGYFAGINYVQGKAGSGLQTLVVDMFDVNVLRPEEGTIDAPLTIPVTNIQSIMAAA